MNAVKISPIDRGPRPLLNLNVLIFSDENKMEYYTPENVSAAAIHCHGVFLLQFRLSFHGAQ